MTIFISCRTAGETCTPTPFDTAGNIGVALRLLSTYHAESDRAGRKPFTATESDVDTGKAALTITDGGEVLDFFLTTTRATPSDVHLPEVVTTAMDVQTPAPAVLTRALAALRGCTVEQLTALAYGEFAPIPFLADIPAWLGEAAYDELDRVQFGAVS